MRSRPRTRLHWIVLLTAILAPAVPLLLARALDPDPRGFGTHEQLGMRPCGLYASVGVPCPGCGVTTSVTLAGEGRFADSLRVQPLGFLLALAAALSLPWALAAHLRGRDLWSDLRRLPVLWTGVAATLVVAAAWLYKLIQMA